MKNLFLFLLFLNNAWVLSAQYNPDSLWAIWSDESQPVITRLEAIDAIHTDENGYSRPNNPDTAFYHAQLQYDLANANGLQKWMANALMSQGNFFAKKADFKKANEYYTRSRTIGEEIGDQELIADNTYNMGIGFLKQTNYTEGFPAFTQSAKLYEAIGDKKKQANSLDKIGVMYLYNKDLKNSLVYLQQALAIREELIKTNDNFRDQFVISGMKKTIKTLREQLGDTITTPDLDTSDLTTQNTKAYEKELLASNDPKSLVSLGISSLEQNENDKALEYFFKSLKKSEEIGDKTAIRMSLMNIGRSYLDQKNDSKGIHYLNKSLAIAKEEKDLVGIAALSEVLTQAYKSTRQYRKSLETFELYIETRDSIVNLENEKAAARQEIQTNYDKQKAIDDIENAKLVTKETQKKKNQQVLSAVIGAGLLLALLLALVIFNRLKVTRQQKAIIEEQKKKVEQSEKYKEQFLANMSHEIRTPMHAISGMVKILKRNEHLPTQDTFLNAMHTSSDNLVVILNDVLDLSKIEAGKLDIESIPMRPTAVLENVTQILKYKAEEKGLQLNYQIEEEVPDLIMGDPTRLNQILINLAGNAIKFTEKGNVNILLQKENDRLRFSIKDTGIGIPKEKVETIFEAFEQAKGSTNRNYGGTGLGLSISKQLVELQQGKIWAESEEGKGSTFFVELPLVAAAANAVSENLITEDRLKMMTTSLKGIRILLAEDNAFNQMIAQDDLSFFIKDVTIDVVENGALAVEKFKTGNYDLILMDVQMPEMNGFEATQKIREIEKLAGGATRIPIIAMTASLLKTEIENCRQAGMDNYIPKPYQPEELIAPIFSEMN